VIEIVKATGEKLGHQVILLFKAYARSATNGNDSKIFRVDSFVAYAYTCRIFNVYPVANNRVHNPRKTTRAKRTLFLARWKVRKGSENYFLVG